MSPAEHTTSNEAGMGEAGMGEAGMGEAGMREVGMEEAGMRAAGMGEAGNEATLTPVLLTHDNLLCLACKSISRMTPLEEYFLHTCLGDI